LSDGPDPALGQRVGLLFHRVLFTNYPDDFNWLGDFCFTSVRPTLSGLPFA